MFIFRCIIHSGNLHQINSPFYGWTHFHLIFHNFQFRVDRSILAAHAVRDHPHNYYVISFWRILDLPTYPLSESDKTKNRKWYFPRPTYLPVLTPPAFLHVRLRMQMACICDNMTDLNATPVTFLFGAGKCGNAPFPPKNYTSLHQRIDQNWSAFLQRGQSVPPKG